MLIEYLKKRIWPYKDKKKPIHILRQQRLVRIAMSSIIVYSGYAKRLREQAILKDKIPPWRIINYPHIINPEDSPIPIRFDNYVRPETFEKNLKFLKNHFDIIPLPRLLKAIHNGERIKTDAISITFDHCWADAYASAFPLLKAYKIPATFFISSAYPNTYNLTWQDTLRVALFILKNSQIPFPELSALGQEFNEWIEEITEDFSISENVIELLIDFLTTEAPEIRLKCVMDILAHVQVMGEMPEFSMYANWDEIREMSNHELISIGTHGHGHKNLKELSREELIEDMQLGLKHLRDNKIETIQALSLPGGMFNNQLQIQLSEMNLRFALGNVVGFDIDPSKHGTIILERVNIDEACASSHSILTLRILSVPIPTQRYIRK